MVEPLFFGVISQRYRVLCKGCYLPGDGIAHWLEKWKAKNLM